MVLILGDPVNLNAFFGIYLPFPMNVPEQLTMIIQSVSSLKDRASCRGVCQDWRDMADDHLVWSDAWVRLKDKDNFDRECWSGNLEAVSWVARVVRPTPADIRVNNNDTLCAAAEGGSVPMLEYLIDTFGLTAADVRSDQCYALRIACSKGHLDAVRYLVERFNLTAADVRGQGNYVLSLVCEQGDLSMARYLVEELGLTRNDLRHDVAAKTFLNGWVETARWVNALPAPPFPAEHLLTEFRELMVDAFPNGDGPGYGGDRCVRLVSLYTRVLDPDMANALLSFPGIADKMLGELADEVIMYPTLAGLAHCVELVYR